jgi:drug/metabolite transporter (DMT)-like permease
LTAALFYLGAGIGITFLRFTGVRKKAGHPIEPIARKDIRYVVGMVFLDISAAILLMAGINKTSAGNASLLVNFEITATALIALLIFGEPVGKRLWLSIALITFACVLLSLGEKECLAFSSGSALILSACICWGFENNCTKKLSHKDPLKIVMIKGLGTGVGSLVISLILHERSANAVYISLALFVGFVSYGLSIFFYISAQAQLGAAKTSAFYAIAPFIGAFISFLIFRQLPDLVFFIALALMAGGVYLAVRDRHKHSHEHEVLVHAHLHCHTDGHHNHMHDGIRTDWHSHVHTHEAIIHTHEHGCDEHHSHCH